MHIYYYEKDGFIYVYDYNHKLYRYQKKHNIENILILENCITKLEELKDEQETFRFKTIKEWNNVDWFNMSSFIQSLSLVEYHYFKENTPLVLLIEGILGNLIYQEYKEFKETRKRNNDFYEVLLERKIEDIKEYVNSLKKLENITKVEVSYEHLDPSAKKTYIDDEKTFNSIFEKIYAELEANIKPILFFSYLDEDSTLNAAEQMEQENPIEVKQKINYAMVKSWKNAFFIGADILFSTPFIAQLLENYQIKNISDSNLKNGFFITALFYFFGYAYSKQSLKESKNPTLTLKNSK